MKKIEIDALEQALFLQEMDGVQPLQTVQKVRLNTKAMDAQSAQLRRHAAMTDVPVLEAQLGRHNVQQIAPQDPYGFKANGVQEGVFRKLRLGRYEIEARLDLHRHTLAQAEIQLQRFIAECLEHDIRTVLVLPGKGDRDSATPAVLKSHLAHWLQEMMEVQAFHTAQPQHGGAGAFYVLLRKSDRKKTAGARVIF